MIEGLSVEEQPPGPGLLDAAQQSPVALFALDSQCRFVQANGAGRALAGVELAGRRFCEVFRAAPCSPPDGPMCLFARARHGQEQRTRPRWTALEVAGTSYPVLLGAATAPGPVAGAARPSSGCHGVTVTMIPSALVDDADRRRREMLAAAVHDIRHPVTVQSLALEVLTSQVPDTLAPALAPLLERMRRTTAYLTTSVDELLNRMLFDLGTLTVRPRSIELRPLVEQVIWNIEPILERRGQRVRLSMARDLQVRADPAALEHVLTNLLLNAHKYSVEGDQFVVSAVQRKRRQAIEIAVRDHGPGIPEAERRRVFERFFRGARATGQRGAGLGLHIVRTIIDLHGGAVGIRAPAGGGTQVWLHLPVQAEVTRAEVE